MQKLNYATYSNGITLRCSLSEGTSRSKKKLGLKAPLRTMPVIGCMGVGVWVHSHVGSCLSSFLVNCYTFHS